jgi:hypothetical protein
MHAPESIVAVGDSSLVLSTIGKCLDEERVFDIQSVLDNIDQIHSDAAGIEQAEERLEQVLRGVFAYCHGSCFPESGCGSDCRAHVYAASLGASSIRV